MAADLFDFRAKLTALGDAVLSAHAEALGKDKSEVARDILQEWAERQILVARYIFGAIDGLVPIAPEGREEKPRRVSLTRAARKEVYVRDGAQCAYCGVAVDRGSDWHVDHVIPVSKGGTNDLDNLRLACKACNLAKASGTGIKVA